MMYFSDYQPKPTETTEEKCRRILYKYGKKIYAEYCYMVLIKTHGWNDQLYHYTVRQGFRQIGFSTALETMAFLDRAITYDNQH